MESFTRLFKSISLDDNPPLPSILNSKQFFQVISMLFHKRYSTTTLYTNFLQSYLQSQSKNEQMQKRITQLISQCVSLKSTLSGNPFSTIERILIKQWITQDEKVSKNKFLQDIILLWISCMDSTPMTVNQFINQYKKQASFIGQINRLLYRNALSNDQLQIITQETPHLILTHSFHWKKLCSKYLPQVEGRIGRNQCKHDKMHSSQNYQKISTNKINTTNDKINDSDPLSFLKSIKVTSQDYSLRHALSMEVNIATKMIQNLPFFLNLSDEQNGLPLTKKVMMGLNETNQLSKQIKLLNKMMPALQQDLKEYSTNPIFKQLSKQEKNACLAYCIEKEGLENVQRNIQLSIALVEPKQLNRCSLLFNREVEMPAISILEGVHMISFCSFS